MSGASSTAYLLVTHGSRDRRPQEAMETITQRLRNSLNLSPFLSTTSAHSQAFRDLRPYCEDSDNARLQTRTPPAIRSQDLAQNLAQNLAPSHLAHSQSLDSVSVGAAVLELGPAPLRSQIVEFVEREQLPNGSRLRILPLFLLAGVHVMEDIPEEIAAAQMQLGDRLELDVIPHFGSHAEHLVFLLRQAQARFIEPVPQQWILLAHGSRRSQAIVRIEALAQTLGMKTAYWVQKGSLRQRVLEVIEQIPDLASDSDLDSHPTPESPSQAMTLGILPCFLFEGGLTDAIASQVLELGLEFPQVELRLGPTLSSLPGFSARVQAAMA